MENPVGRAATVSGPREVTAKQAWNYTNDSQASTRHNHVLCPKRKPHHVRFRRTLCCWEEGSRQVVRQVSMHPSRSVTRHPSLDVLWTSCRSVASHTILVVLNSITSTGRYADIHMGYVALLQISLCIVCCSVGNTTKQNHS